LPLSEGEQFLTIVIEILHCQANLPSRFNHEVPIFIFCDQSWLL
jgi:hypothetical protein